MDGVYNFMTTYFTNTLSEMVWLISKETGETYKSHLIVRRNAETHNDYKYSLSNTAVYIPLQRLAYMQGQRF